MRILRRQVIKALRTEPLMTGSWVQTINDDRGWFTGISEDAKCPVCAVGATLRACGLDNVQIDIAGGLIMEESLASVSDGARAEGIERNLAGGYYLAALSGQFESTAPKRITKAYRERLIAWVKKNLPVSFDDKSVPELPKRKKAA